MGANTVHAGILKLEPGSFFGGVRLTRRTPGGFEISHRIAEGPPDTVVTHTHADAHFILVSGGRYVDPRRTAWPLDRDLAGEGPRHLDDSRQYLLASGISGACAHDLARTLRRHFGCTPGAFARFRRLERAAALLAETTEPLADVACRWRFADQSHLTHCFARSFGLSPGSYRGLAGAAGRLQINKTALQRWHKVRVTAARAREWVRRGR